MSGRRGLRWTLGVAIAAVALALATPAAQAQAGQRLWVFAQGQAELTERVRLDVEQQLRLDLDLGFEQTFTELGLRYRVARPLRVGGFYRLVVLDGETRHRLGGDVEARVGVGVATLSYRLRVQHTTRDSGGRTALRNRLKVAVDAPHRLAPFAAAELFYVVDKSELREARGSVGVDWAASKRIDLTAFYLYQEELNVNVPEANHVLSLGVSWRMRTVKAAKARRAKRGADVD